MYLQQQTDTIFQNHYKVAGSHRITAEFLWRAILKHFSTNSLLYISPIPSPICESLAWNFLKSFFLMRVFFFFVFMVVVVVLFIIIILFYT